MVTKQTQKPNNFLKFTNGEHCKKYFGNYGI